MLSIKCLQHKVIFIFTLTLSFGKLQYSKAEDLKNRDLVTQISISDDVQDTIVNEINNHENIATSNYHTSESCSSPAAESITDDQMRTSMNTGWVAYVLKDALSTFIPRSRTNHLCNEQSRMYEEDLQNLTLWAVQMQEASAQSTGGMLVGQKFQLGHYDECIAVKTSLIAGRYCLAHFRFEPGERLYPNFRSHKLDGMVAALDKSAWETLKMSTHPARIDRNELHWGLCLPAACSWEDVQWSLTETFARAYQKHGILVNVSLAETFCTAGVDEKPLTTYTNITIYLLVCLSALCIFTTMIHLFLTDTKPDYTGNLGFRLLMSFSLVTNFRRLTFARDDHLTLLDGLKLFSMIYIIVSHRVAFTIASMVYNPTVIEAITFDQNNIWWLGSLVVDTFFTITGFLLFVGFYGPFKKNGIKIYPVIILIRWLRLMPSYMMVIAFIANVLPLIGDGPYWKMGAYTEAQRCQLNWWTNLLGITNIVRRETMCAPTAWYITCDLQLFLVGVLVVYAFSRSHSLGLKIALITLAGSTMISFSHIFFYNLDGAVKYYPRSLANPLNHELIGFYMSPFPRAGPYIIGIIAGYALLEIQKRKLNISMLKRWLILLGTVAVGVVPQWCTFLFYDVKRPYDPIENALFASLHRTCWACMIAATIVIHVGWGLGQVVQTIFAHSIYIPLGRLTFLAYIVHPNFQLTTILSGRLPTYLSNLQMIWFVAGDVLISYLVGLWLYMILDQPLQNIIDLIVKKKSVKK